MDPRRSLVPALAILIVAAPRAAAQQWNSPGALALVRRGVEARERTGPDSTLRSYETRAHGFVFFLAQVGEAGLREPPRVVKADQLVVEVYWRAPNRSKQVVLGWRDGVFLPTDIAYHRDHLGIVTNNFGDRIRIGEGDEVRDVIHPLAPAALELYDYAIADSLTLFAGGRSWTVRAVKVRPRDFSAPRVIGTLYLDAATAQLVRFSFSFTPAAYLDRSLEDITITLSNALYAGRYWLPYRQEIEIRRRFRWLDFPARGIIRGRWEIDEYRLNAAFPDSILAGPAIGGLLGPRPDDPMFTEPLRQAIAGVGQPLDRRDIDAIRASIEAVAGAHRLSGLPTRQLAVGSLSDLVHVNRVQGLALGLGLRLGIGASRVRLEPTVGIGTSDGRAVGGLAAEVGTGATQVTARVSRAVRDVSDFPVISGALNSLLAQEAGKDYGDYVLRDALDLSVARRLSPRTTLTAGAAIERARSLETTATGTYAANPSLGSGIHRVVRLALERSGAGSVAETESTEGGLRIEAGEGRTDYLRVAGDARWRRNFGATQLVIQARAGLGTDSLPPDRSFVVGGRGTLVGEPFRAFGGRRFGLVRVEWRLPVPAPALPLGSFASTGRTMTVAPFVAAGWAEAPSQGLPWISSGGVRPVAGVAAEFFMRLIRVEAGVALRTGHIGVTVDVNPEWWGAL